MSKIVHTDFNMDGNEIQKVSFEKLATDPVSPFAGQYWENTTSNKVKYYDGTTIHVLADEAFVQNIVQQIGQAQGAFDASPGLLPTVSDLIDGDTVIRRGDYWDISVAGVITGIGGADELEIGDVLKFVGVSPTTASDWIGIQRNINDVLLGNTKTERQTVNIVANTPLTVSSSTIPDIFSIQVYNSSGAEIILDVEKGLSPNQRVLTSKKSLTGVVVDLVGSST